MSMWIREPDPAIKELQNLRRVNGQLLWACRALLEYWDHGTPVHSGAEVVSDVRAAIAAATGREVG